MSDSLARVSNRGLRAAPEVVTSRYISFISRTGFCSTPLLREKGA